MTGATLWLEATIAGFPYLLSLFFFVLRWYEIYDLQKIIPLKNFFLSLQSLLLLLPIFLELLLID